MGRGSGKGRGNLFKSIIARDFIFTSKCINKCLTAGFRPDPLGKLKRSTNPLATACSQGRNTPSHPLAAVRIVLWREVLGK